jgi:hypothetical protein
MRVTAKEIADRIVRYKFGARARYGLTICKTSPGPYIWREHIGAIGDVGYAAMTEEQRARATAAQTTIENHVTMLTGRVPPNNPESPVVFVANCWGDLFWDQLVKELNLQISSDIRPSQTGEAFSDFLRDPKRLEHARVVVWLIDDFHLTGFKMTPPPIQKTLEPDK